MPGCAHLKRQQVAGDIKTSHVQGLGTQFKCWQKWQVSTAAELCTSPVYTAHITWQQAVRGTHNRCKPACGHPCAGLNRWR